MIKEFKQFIVRGNLVEIAVGLVMALAFGAVVTSLVADVVTPIIGSIFGSPDFSRLSVKIWNGAVIAYGSFLNAVIAFLSVAVAVFFLVVKPYNHLKNRLSRGEAVEEAVVEPTEEIVLLREIRDALQQRR